MSRIYLSINTIKNSNQSIFLETTFPPCWAYYMPQLYLISNSLKSMNFHELKKYDWVRGELIACPLKRNILPFLWVRPINTLQQSLALITLQWFLSAFRIKSKSLSLSSPTNSLVSSVATTSHSLYSKHTLNLPCSFLPLCLHNNHIQGFTANAPLYSESRFPHHSNLCSSVHCSRVLPEPLRWFEFPVSITVLTYFLVLKLFIYFSVFLVRR